MVVSSAVQTHRHLFFNFVTMQYFAHTGSVSQNRGWVHYFPRFSFDCHSCRMQMTPFALPARLAQTADEHILRHKCLLQRVDRHCGPYPTHCIPCTTVRRLQMYAQFLPPLRVKFSACTSSVPMVCQPISKQYCCVSQSTPLRPHHCKCSYPQAL